MYCKPRELSPKPRGLKTRLGLGLRPKRRAKQISVFYLNNRSKPDKFRFAEEQKKKDARRDAETHVLLAENMKKNYF